MTPRPPRSTRTDTLFPYTTLFRSRRAAAARTALAGAPGIDFVEADAPVEAMRTPTDTFWSYQWGPRTVSAPAAWDVTTGASAVVIAILDTGVTPGPAFAGKLLAGIHFVTGPPAPAAHPAQHPRPPPPAGRTSGAHGRWRPPPPGTSPPAPPTS